jgi:hypothetical protein
MKPETEAPPSEQSSEQTPKKATHKPVKALIIVGLMLLILAGAWLATRGGEGGLTGGSSKKSLKNGSYIYNVDFSRDAKEVKLQDQTALNGKIDGQTMALFAQPVSWPVIDDCAIVGPESKPAFKSSIDDKDYQVCHEGNLSYVTVFEDADQKHQINVLSSDRKTKLDNQAVQDLIESLTVSKS